MCNKKEESEEKSPGDIELNMTKSDSPVDVATLDLEMKNSKLVEKLGEARKKAEYAASAQDISAIVSAVSQLLVAQEAMADVQMAQAEFKILNGTKISCLNFLCSFLN